jgi:hypothetical protein
MSARAADGATQEALSALDLPESRYQGPTGFTSALLDACQRRGMPAAGLSARAPHYAQGTVHPSLSAALLATAGRLHGLALPVDELEAAGREQARVITQRLQQEPKLWQYVQQVAEEQAQDEAFDAYQRGGWRTVARHQPDDAAPPASAPDLPSGTEMVDAVEAFLRGGRAG